jgi:hypothetical protein
MDECAHGDGTRELMQGTDGARRLNLASEWRLSRSRASTPPPGPGAPQTFAVSSSPTAPLAARG